MTDEHEATFFTEGIRFMPILLLPFSELFEFKWVNAILSYPLTAQRTGRTDYWRAASAATDKT